MAKKIKKAKTRARVRVTVSRKASHTRPSAKFKRRSLSPGIGAFFSRFKPGSKKKSGRNSKGKPQRASSRQSKKVSPGRKTPLKRASPRVGRESTRTRKSRSRVRSPRRDERGRFVRSSHARANRKIVSKPKRRVAPPFVSHDEVKTITSPTLGGEFEMQKRTLEFKRRPRRLEKLPYRKQIKKAAEEFFEEQGAGLYLYKVKVELVDDDGEIFDRWFTPHYRRGYRSEGEYADSLDDLTLTMQELARGYVVDSFENYRLAKIEMEKI